MRDILWAPSGAAARGSQLAAFIGALRASGVDTLPAAGHRNAFAALHEWSTTHIEQFWAAAWRFCGVVAAERPGAAPWDHVLTGGESLEPPIAGRGPRWFPGARLNLAENLLRGPDDAPAIISWTEEGPGPRLTQAELRRAVADCAAGLRACGVQPGDRIAAVLPNVVESVVAMLAAVSLGAVWSSCSPDFGPAAVVDRFGQIAPRVLFAADGYRYAGKRIDIRARVADIAARLPSLERVVVVPVLEPRPDLGPLRGAVRWDEFAAPTGAPRPPYSRLPFDHPAFILYSSGTTGLPKCIVHGAGGTLLQLLKEHVLHVDLRPEDRLFYATTCGWMMWNWLVAALATGAAIVLYDGSPLPPGRPAVLWDLADREGVTVFGTSARYLAVAEQEGLAPVRTHALGALRTILSTGSPLADRSFDYVYRDVAPAVQLGSISGGTDIVSCFALVNPLSPVRRGEIQGRGLGMRVEVFDERGAPVIGTPGELVCTRPFPSMPVAFWNDADGAKYRAAYFARYPNVWTHGDWASLTPEGGVVIYGRSDTTLNPGGVRIGTAEIYRQVDQVPEVADSVVVTYDGRADGAAGAGEVVLFVRLAAGAALDAALEARIRDLIRRNTSPHHVPRRIRSVRDIPRTINGKTSERAVRDALHGRAVQNIDALANPSALDEYRALASALDW